MTNKLLPLVGAALLLAAGCGTALSPHAFKQHVENPANGFVQTAGSGPYQITCTYTPPEYLAVQSFRSNAIDRGEFEAREKELGAYDMYRLEITAADTRHMQGLAEYFGFYMQNEIAKICGTDTLPCVVYHGEPLAMDGKQKIEVGFAHHCTENETVWLRGTPFGGSVALPFSKKTLSIPAISLQ